MGCSTGGRQGVQSALKFPHDFDGILAGAPAADLNHLLGWTGMIERALGAPEGEQSEKYIGATGWELVVQEVLRQCDALDGRLDGIVGEPDECQFDVSTLACAEGWMDEGCLTKEQVEALRKIYSPLVGSDEKTLLYPRFDPGAERVALRGGILGPQIFAYTKVRPLSSPCFPSLSTEVGPMLTWDWCSPSGLVAIRHLQRLRLHVR